MPTRKELIEQVRADQRARSSRARADNPKSAIVGIGDRDPLTGLHEVLLPDGSVEMGEKQFNSSLPNGNQVLGVPQSTGGWLLDERDVQPIKPIPQPSPMGKIKVLFSTIEGTDRVFYIGGDRATPKKIYTISKDLYVTKASLNNAGDGDRYVAGLQWESIGENYISTYHTTSITSGKLWETENIVESGGFDILGYYGFDFWTQERAQYGLEGIVRSTTTVTSQLANYDTPDFSVVGSQFLDAADYFPCIHHIGTISGSGQYRKVSTLGPATVLDEAGERNSASINYLVQESTDYSFSVTLISYYKGVMTQTTGSSISFHAPLTENRLQGYWSGSPISGNLTSSTLRFQTVQSQIAPNIVKASLSTAQGSFSSSSVGYTTVSDNNVVQTKDTKIPLLVGDRGQSLYQQLGYTSTYHDISPSAPSLAESSFTDYYLATTQSEIKLGGKLPKKASDPTIVEFRVSDNLIKSKYHRVQLDASTFGKPTKPDVDIHSLSANSTKKTIKARMYGIPKPSSGMPTDAAGLAALTSQLRQGQPVTIGNVTIYNASYHP